MNKVKQIREDLARAAYATAHSVDPADIYEGDLPDILELEDAIDTVFVNHGIIDFDRHFPHTHASDNGTSYCTYTAVTGEMCMEPIT